MYIIKQRSDHGVDAPTHPQGPIRVFPKVVEPGIATKVVRCRGHRDQEEQQQDCGDHDAPNLCAQPQCCSHPAAASLYTCPSCPEDGDGPDDLLGMCSMLKNNTPVVKLVCVEYKDSYTGNWSRISKLNSREEFNASVPPHLEKPAWQH